MTETPPGSAAPHGSDLHVTIHAEDRLVERGITREQVERALQRPSGDPYPGEPGSIWIKGYADGERILKVCVRVDDHAFVITAVWDDKTVRRGEGGGRP